MDVFKWRKKIPFSSQSDWIISSGEGDEDKRRGMIKSLIGLWRVQKKKPLLSLEADRFHDSIYEVPVSRVNPLYKDNEELSSGTPSTGNDSAQNTDEVPDAVEESEKDKSAGLEEAPHGSTQSDRSVEPKTSALQTTDSTDPSEQTPEGQGKDDNNKVNEALHVLDSAISESTKETPESSAGSAKEEPVASHLENTSEIADETEHSREVESSNAEIKQPNDANASANESDLVVDSQPDLVEGPAAVEDQYASTESNDIQVVEHAEVNPGHSGQAETENMPREDADERSKATKSVFGSAENDRRDGSSSSTSSDSSETRPLQKNSSEGLTIKKALRVRAKAIEELIKKFQAPAENEKNSPVNSTKVGTKTRVKVFPTVQAQSSESNKGVQVPISPPPQSTPVLTFPPPPPLPPGDQSTRAKHPSKTDKLEKQNSSVRKESVARTSSVKEETVTSSSSSSRNSSVEKIDQVPPVQSPNELAVKPSQTVTSQERHRKTTKPEVGRKSYLHDKVTDSFSTTGLFNAASSRPPAVSETPKELPKLTRTESSNSSAKEAKSIRSENTEESKVKDSTHDAVVGNESAAGATGIRSKTDAAKNTSGKVEHANSASSLSRKTVKSLSDNTSNNNSDRQKAHPASSKLSIKKQKPRDGAAKSERKSSAESYKPLSEDSGVTKTDQTSTDSHVPDIIEKPEASDPSEPLEPKAGNTEVRQEKVTTGKERKRTLKPSRHHSCRHHRQDKDDFFGFSKGKCDDYYDKVIRRQERTHRSHRPGSWTSDLSWDEYLEREYVTQASRDELPFVRRLNSNSSLRSSYFPYGSHGRRMYGQPYLLKRVLPEDLPKVHLSPQGTASRRSSSEDSLAACRLAVPFCPCQECWMSLWRESVLARSSVRSRMPLWDGVPVCTCGKEPSVASARKVKFAEHRKEGSAAERLSRTSEVPETDSEAQRNESSQKSSEKETSSSSEHLSSILSTENYIKHKGSSKSSKKEKDSASISNGNLKPKFNVGDVFHAHPWEIEGWEQAIRKRQLKKRRRRAQFMALMALIMVIFVGLIVGIVMVYLRRKTL